MGYYLGVTLKFLENIMDLNDLLAGLGVVAFLWLCTRDGHTKTTTREFMIVLIGLIALIVIGRVYNSEASLFF